MPFARTLRAALAGVCLLTAAGCQAKPSGHG